MILCVCPKKVYIHILNSRFVQFKPISVMEDAATGHVPDSQVRYTFIWCSDCLASASNIRPRSRLGLENSASASALPRLGLADSASASVSVS